jgi:hypothetical protein
MSFMLLHINEKFTMEKLKSSLFSYIFVLSRFSLSISRCRSTKLPSVSVSQITTDMFRFFCFYVITIRSFPHSSLITGFVIRVTRRVPHVEQKPLTRNIAESRVKHNKSNQIKSIGNDLVFILGTSCMIAVTS